MAKIREALDIIKPYVPGKPIDEVKRELGIEEVYKLASNENPLGPSEKAVEAMRTAAGKVSLYPDADCYELRMAVAKKHNVDPREIIFGEGSNELLKLISLALLDPGDEIVMPSPSFGEYARTAYLCNAKVKAVPLTEDLVVDLPAMAAAISSKTKIVYVCNPNNPTGTTVDKKLLKQVMHRMKDVTVVMDEAYYEFVNADNSPDGVELFREFPNVVALRTFSKAYGLAGIRVGYGICSKEFAEAINKVREPFNINSIAQIAAITSIGDKEYLKKSVEHNAVEREYLFNQLKSRGYKVADTQANFMFFDCLRDSVEIFKALLQKGIIVRSGDIFGYPTCIRLSVGLRKENDAFLKAFDEVMKV